MGLGRRCFLCVFATCAFQCALCSVNGGARLEVGYQWYLSRRLGLRDAVTWSQRLASVAQTTLLPPAPHHGPGSQEPRPSFLASMPIPSRNRVAQWVRIELAIKAICPKIRGDNRVGADHHLPCHSRPAFTPHLRARHFQIGHTIIPSQFTHTRRSTQKGNKGKPLFNPLSPSSFSPPSSPSCVWNPQSYPWTSMNTSSGSVNFGSRHV